MNQNALKAAVAQAAIEHISNKITIHSIIGIGTGSTANLFIDKLAELKGQFRGTVASSNASAERLAQHDIAVFELNDIHSMDFYIDGTDESDANLNLIKGGGAALTREKIVATCAGSFICIADESKWVKTLGNFPLPIEIIPMARSLVTRALTKLGGRPVFREGCTTDNGNHILDIHDLSITEPEKMEREINQIPGVVTNGLFASRKADVLLLGTQQGVRTYLPENI